jgi:hypothetical protein
LYFNCWITSTAGLAGRTCSSSSNPGNKSAEWRPTDPLFSNFEMGLDKRAFARRFNF